jgi:Bacterial Ig domain/Putative Ig domain/Domain of unknown function DUF11
MNNFGLLSRHPRAPRARGRVLAAAGAGVLVVAGGLAVAPGVTAAQAATGDPVCSVAFCTVTLGTPGTGQSFTVPAGVHSLEVTLYGGTGGANYDGDVSGGDGAEVTAGLSTSPGAVLGVDVGGAGEGGDASDSPDYQGGVNGGGAGEYSGAGGGATDITSGGTDLLVAGGGGGAGADKADPGTCFSGVGSLAGGAGGNADTTGSPGQGVSDGGFDLFGGAGGQPGTTSPGIGGIGGPVNGSAPCGNYGTSPGDAGATGSGTTGGSGAGNTGGGGGGGYSGGGAGGGGASALDINTSSLVNAAYGGGGGGASYGGGAGVEDYSVTDTGNSGQVNGGDGEAVLTYVDPIVAQSPGPSYTTPAQQTLTVSAGSGLLSSAGLSAFPPGDTLTASGPAGGQSAQGGTVTVNSDGSFSYSPPSGFTGSDTFGYTVSDTSGDYATGTATVQVQPLAQSIAFTSDAPSPGVVGGSYTPAASGGGSGNPVTFSIDPTSTAGACSISSGVVSFNGTGLCVIDANQAAGGVYAAAQQASQPVTVDAAPAFVLDTPPATATVGQIYSYSFAASGTPAPFYSLAPDAPSWLSIDASTGTVSGKPPKGTRAFAFEVTATNVAGSSVAGPYEISVAPKAPKANLVTSLSCPKNLVKGTTGVCALSVINNGPATAVNVSIAALLQSKLAETSCTGGCVLHGTNTYVWTLPSLASVSAVYYTITVKGTQKGSGVLAIDATSATTDPHPFNNVTTKQIYIKPA